MKKDKFLIVCSDDKMIQCKNTLVDLGYDAVCVQDNYFLNLLGKCKNIILPLPTVKDGKVPCTTVSFEYILDKLSQEQNLFYGNIENVVTDKSAYSYYYNDQFLEMNTRLTAQGVLKITLDNIQKDLYSLSVCILGNGRCGRALSDLFVKLGSKVTVFARRKINFTNNVCFENIYNADKCLGGFDVIVNTIPFNIIDKNTIGSLNQKNLYIEIASAPYGFDVKNINTTGFRYIPASSLPGKYTPLSAGENIANTVLQILKEVELG